MITASYMQFVGFYWITNAWMHTLEAALSGTSFGAAVGFLG